MSDHSPADGPRHDDPATVQAIAGNGLRQVPLALLPEMADAAWRAGFLISHVPLAGVADKTGLLAAFASGLGFPPGIGGNWDSLADALSDLSWLDSQAHALLIDGAAQLRAQAPDVLAPAIEIIDEAAAHWADGGQHFQAFLADAAMPLDAA